jgi:hypothetical protein
MASTKPPEPGKRDDRPRWWPWVDFLLFDEVGVAILFAVGAFLLLIFFVLPALLFVLQVLIFLALVAVSVLGRILLRRPWKIEAVRMGDPPQRLEWAVVGWLRSRRVLGEIAQSLSNGHRFIEPEGAQVIRRPATEG